MSKGSFGQFAAKSGELLAPLALRALLRGVDSLLLCRVLVAPSSLLWRSPLGDVGLHAEIRSERDHLRRMVALVGDDRLDFVLSTSLLVLLR